MAGWSRGAAATVAVLGLLLTAACGDDEDGADTTTSTTGSTTVPPEATTTTTEGTTTTVVVLAEDPPLDEDGPSGSGCAPGSGDLPDGWWYGRVDGPVGDDISFDLACYYVGAAAEAEAASRGDEVNNDYYVVNDSPQVRTLPVADAATASCVALGAGLEMVDCSAGDVVGDWAVWLRVQGGEVDRLVEQYAP
jgi:hypothetical protein